MNESVTELGREPRVEVKLKETARCPGYLAHTTSRTESKFKQKTIKTFY